MYAGRFSKSYPTVAIECRRITSTGCSQNSTILYRRRHRKSRHSRKVPRRRLSISERTIKVRQAVLEKSHKRILSPSRRIGRLGIKQKLSEREAIQQSHEEVSESIMIGKNSNFTHKLDRCASGYRALTRLPQPIRLPKKSASASFHRRIFVKLLSQLASSSLRN
jgi:hypothetical protein